VVCGPVPPVQLDPEMRRLLERMGKRPEGPTPSKRGLVRRSSGPLPHVVGRAEGQGGPVPETTGTVKRVPCRAGTARGRSAGRE
jgi:hypothetical protein